MQKFLYTLAYDDTEKELSKLESKIIFTQEDEAKIILSNIKVEPSNSAFIKSRLEIRHDSTDYDSLIKEIKKEKISIEGFKVEYLVFDGDKTPYDQRLKKLKDIGYSIEGIPDYYKPSITYALCYYDKTWRFGVLTKDKYIWRKHKEKPYSYSNSININIAKALVTIASQADITKKILDACCGVGTIMLEACFVGVDVDGCDINWKVCKGARGNLAYFNYSADVFRSDIRDMDKPYDAAIIDLPYNLLSSASSKDVHAIIESSARLTERLVIVSTADITQIIDSIGFGLIDFCSVSKKGKTSFERKIWVCEKKNLH